MREAIEQAKKSSSIFQLSYCSSEYTKYCRLNLTLDDLAYKK